MIKLLSKTAILTFITACTAFGAKAQVGFDFSHYDVGFAAGFNAVYGDALPKTTTQSFHLNLTYNTTPYVNFVFEAQMGRLRGGDSLTTATGRQFNNDFTAFVFRGQLQFGEFLDYSHNSFNNAAKIFMYPPVWALL